MSVTSKTRFISPNWILIVGQLLAQLSDRMLTIGLIWIISKNFGAEMVTWYLVVGGLPHLLFFALSAKLIQFFGALHVVIGADVIRSVIYLFAGFIVQNISEQTDLYKIMALIFATSTMAAFFNPAIYTLPVEIETGEGVQKLTARITAVNSISTVLGPILGILCFQALGLQGLFFSTAFFYLVSGFCGVALRSRIALGEKPPIRDEKKIGLKLSPLIISMLLVFLMMNLLTTPMQILIPTMAKNNFSGGFNSLATLEIGLGFGIAIGGIILSFFAIKTKPLLYTWIFLIGISISFITFQFSQNIWIAGLLLMALGLFVGLANILILNIFQSQPHPELVPKVMSLVNLISSAAVPLSLLAAGLLQTQFTIYRISKTCAVLLLIVCALSCIPFRKWGKELF